MSDAESVPGADRTAGTTIDELDATATPETVLITGCSSGIGRATAAAFRAEGWTTYATARDPDDLAALAEDGCHTAALDVTDEGDVHRVVDRVADEQGRLDCLVNNAGYGQLGPVEDVPVETMHEQFEVNVYGPHRLTRVALPIMREAGGGTIVNLSSVSGRVSTPGSGVYSASKFAIEALSDALRTEVAPFDVNVVLVEPGPVDTRFRDRATSAASGLPRTEAYESLYEAIDDYETIGGPGPASITPTAVADAVVNAASCTNPSPRYPVGGLARAMAFARFLPDRWRDRLYRVALWVLG
jgi:NAD(P)-dependent dehydrogenase (short-subunit alcohol dehydrogenase family)